MREAAINIRALPQQRDLIDQAAQVLGKNRSDFMLEAACDKAQSVLLDQVFFSLDRHKFEQFKAMLDGLKGSKNMTGALDALNIKETREVSTLQKLAGNMDVYNQAMMDAQESYANGSFLSDAYGKTQDNLATKMELVNNQVKMLQDSFGQALAPLFMVLADAAKSVLEIFNSMSKNPMGQWAMRLVRWMALILIK